LDEDNLLVKKGRIFLTGFKDVMGRRFDPDYYSILYKKIHKKIEFGKYQTEKIGNNCLDVFSGKTPASSDYSELPTLYPIVKVGSYSNYMIDIEKIAYTKSKQQHSIQKGDIFVLSAAHQTEYVGKHIKYLENTPMAATSFVGELICIRTDPKKLLSNFLFSLLNTEYYKTLINREKTGQTSHIYSKDIKNIEVPIPPIVKQNQIVEKIQEIRQSATKLQQEAMKIIELAKQQVEQMILAN
jgi:restriction endonuclease S subunit